MRRIKGDARIAVVLALTFTTGCSAMSRSDSKPSPESDNKRLVQAAFDRWRAGTGRPFELLADDARWTIAGSSPFSKTYESKEDFMAEVIRPFNARMRHPLRPTLLGVYCDGDTVIVLFDG